LVALNGIPNGDSKEGAREKTKAQLAKADHQLFDGHPQLDQQDQRKTQLFHSPNEYGFSESNSLFVGLAAAVAFVLMYLLVAVVFQDFALALAAGVIGCGLVVFGFWRMI
jgi:Flp pilus assembly protein TadB